MSAQIQLTNQHLNAEISRLKTAVAKESLTQEESEAIRIDVTKAEKERQLLVKMEREIRKMKKGSIALINQIRTISKIRIYDPKTSHDILSHVRLSNQKLDLIDAALIGCYTGRK